MGLGGKEGRRGCQKRGPYLLQKSQGRGLPQARGRAGDEGRDMTECHVLRAVRCGVVCVACGVVEVGEGRQAE